MSTPSSVGLFRERIPAASAPTRLLLPTGADLTIAELLLGPHSVDVTPTPLSPFSTSTLCLTPFTLPLKRWLSECGPRTGSITVTRELARKVNSWASPPSPTAISFNTPSG